jgi:transforming growth factor-beta-induced protein
MNLMRFLSYTKHVMLVLALLTTVGLSGCDDEEDGPTRTIWAEVEANSDLSIVKDQLLAAGFNTTLDANTGTKYTLFAPSNQAMTNLLQTLFNSTDPALFAQIAPTVIQSVLNYHIAESENLSASLTNGAEITTKQGEKIKVVVTSTGEKTLDTGATSDSKVSTADIKATNGVVHVVDVVLVPPTLGALIVQTLGKVAQPILLSGSFTTLSAAIQKADAGKAPANTIVGALVGLPAVTMFAVPNQVFTAAGITVDTYTAAQWDAILRGHIVNQNLATLSAGDKTALNGKAITVALGSPATVKGSANANVVPIAGAAISASNGVVYPIGGIILHNP